MQAFHFQERSSLLRRLGTFNDLEVSQRSSTDNDLEETVSITGLETFSLSYKVFSSLYASESHPPICIINVPTFGSGFRCTGHCL